MKRKIVVNTNCYHGFTIDEALTGIKDAGFHLIELTATKGWTEHVFPNHEFKELQRVKDKINDLGLKVVALSGHTNLMDHARIPDFIDNIHLANFYGASYIVSSIGEAHLEDQHRANDQELIKNIELLIPLLDLYDMTLVLEVHGDHGTGAIINKIVNALNNKRVKLAYDTANVLFYSDVDLKQDLSDSAENIAYVHIKDKAGKRDEWNFPALGEGMIDFEELIEVLNQKGNDSPLSLEVEFTDKGPKNLQEVNDAMITSRKYLERLGLLDD